MENRNSYTMVGMFFLICVTALVGFMWWMNGTDSQKLRYKNYYIHTNELPSGLKVDSQVKFIGVPAGAVSKIDFVRGQDAVIEITLKIRDDLPIKKDSVASIEMQVISGVASINISRGEQDFSEGERPLIKLENSFLAKMRDDVQNMGEKIYETLERVDGLLSTKNMKNLEATLENLQTFSARLASEENSKNIAEILANAKDVSSGMAAFMEDINKSKIATNANSLIKNTNSLIGFASGFVNELDSTQEAVRERIVSGEFDLRQMLMPALLEATNLLTDFQKTLREFRGALYRLEENPYEFFFKEPIENKDKKGE